MNLSLFHKNALVCGGSKGIGRATAYELAELGANVFLMARSADELQSVVDDLPQQGDQHHGLYTADFTDRAGLERTMEDVVSNRNYHILVNNTGGPPGGPITDAEPEDFLTAFQMHVIACQIITGHIVPGMKEEGYGRIVNVISTSVKEPIPGLGVSNTIRGAMGNWSKTLAAELGPDQITVNNVLPGFTSTSRLDEIITKKMKVMQKSRQEVEDAMRGTVPLRRFADPSEVAQVIAFLVGPAASYVSGINVPVDGGRTKSL